MAAPLRASRAGLRETAPFNAIVHCHRPSVLLADLPNDAAHLCKLHAFAADSAPAAASSGAASSTAPVPLLQVRPRCPRHTETSTLQPLLLLPPNSRQCRCFTPAGACIEPSAHTAGRPRVMQQPTARCGACVHACSATSTHTRLLRQDLLRACEEQHLRCCVTLGCATLTVYRCCSYGPECATCRTQVSQPGCLMGSGAAKLLILPD
jgi:hypothetical protein